MRLVPDDVLERLAAERGPDSHEAKAVHNLRSGRADDSRVFAFQVDDFYMVGLLPDNPTETMLRLAAEHRKRARIISRSY